MYRLAVEATEMAARLERNYRYSLGEDVRLGVKRALLSITLAGKGEEKESNIRSARHSMLDVQLSLRLLEDLKILPDKRYVYFLEMTLSLDSLKRFRSRIDYPLVKYLLEVIILDDPTQNCRLQGITADWDGLPNSKSLFHSPPGCAGFKAFFFLC